jgi:hypothetical protein
LWFYMERVLHGHFRRESLCILVMKMGIIKIV